MRVLVVDSDSKSLTDLKHRLLVLKYRVTSCRNGGYASQLLLDNGVTFDLIMVDYKVPDLKEFDRLISSKVKDTVNGGGIDNDEERIIMNNELDEAPMEKQRLIWTDGLCQQFRRAVQQLGGIQSAKTNEILLLMENSEEVKKILREELKFFKPITRAHISSHLQKVKDHIKSGMLEAMDFQEMHDVNRSSNPTVQQPLQSSVYMCSGAQMSFLSSNEADETSKQSQHFHCYH
ncbi:hypothetical protein QJS04_geneDACA004540 [Acorus gramineus]|uniref:Response regulatory domain-containing protein n=1 Tax=Acorus gramineus TaxID=55184 RepID=A0AAV9BY42_ACOGR|nr:hypothetical protein QJS04_geneDACA004540 [Acorus gramineus]